MDRGFDYGHWGWAALNIIPWLLTTSALLRPSSFREQCAWVLFAAFVVDVFVERHVFPLTSALLSELSGTHGAGDQPFFRVGDLRRVLLGENSQLGLHDIIFFGGGILIFAGVAIMIYSWITLNHAREGGLPATTGPYAWNRHPQYFGLTLVMVGFMVQGATLIIFLLFPLIIFLYLCLARNEERLTLERFGDRYGEYMRTTPAFIPRF